MARDTSGAYTLAAGNPVITGTTITTAWANGTLSDIAAALTDSLSRSGLGGMTAPVRGLVGTAGAPAFSFSAFTDTGVFSPSANALGFATGGSARVTIGSAGNVVVNAPVSGDALSVTGAVVATSFAGAGSALTALSASNLSTGTVPDGRFPATLPAISGANLTSLNATNLGTGTIPDARFPATLPALNASNLTALNASNLATGTLPDARFPATLPTVSGANLTALNASNLASGTVPDARFPATLPAVSGVNLTALNATNLASGTVADARLSTNVATLSGAQTFTGTKTFGTVVLGTDSTVNSETIGYRKIPRSTTSGTLVVSDLARCVAVTAAITVPASVFAAGDAVTIYNNSASNVTITQGSGLTLRLAGTATTGNRTLAQRGVATVWFNTATDAVISGSGLS